MSKYKKTNVTGIHSNRKNKSLILLGFYY
jgi:hypothetical protein